jgi:hypothetical protein
LCSADRIVGEKEVNMLRQRLLAGRAPEVRDEFVIVSHHPDRLRRPPGHLGALDRDRLTQALTWNVFRTLELIAPAFWLRRLHVRLAGELSFVPPQIVRVSLWRPLSLPPIQQIDGARPDVVADVVIETEHAVWTMGTVVAADRQDADVVTEIIDAGAWLAGSRDHYSGLIEPRTTEISFGGVLKRRYGRSHASVELQTATRGPARPKSTTFGVLEWNDLITILKDCEAAPNLSAIERTLARNAIVWLDAVVDLTTL